MTKDQAKTYLQDIFRLLIVVAVACGVSSALGYMYDSQMLILDRTDMHIRTFGLASIGFIFAGIISYLMLGFRETTPFDRMVVLSTSVFSVVATALVLQLPMIPPEARPDMPGATAAQLVVASLLGATSLAMLAELVNLLVRPSDRHQSQLHRVFFAVASGAGVTLISLFLPVTQWLEPYSVFIGLGVSVLSLGVFYATNAFETRRPKVWTDEDMKKGAE